MHSLSKEQSASREKTLLTALLLSAPGPLFTGYAVLTSHSTTQFADFLRRGVELAALFVSWWVFRQLLRRPAGTESAPIMAAPIMAAPTMAAPTMAAPIMAAVEMTRQARLERLAGLSVAGAMLCSGAAMLLLALSRLTVYEPGGRVTVGLIIAVLGLLTNGWFWRRYTALTREQYSAVIAAQQGLYRAKTSIDFCVVVALAAVAVAPAHPVTRYVDILGSVIVAAFLLRNGLNTARSHFGPLRKLFHHWREHPGQTVSLRIEKEE